MQVVKTVEPATFEGRYQVGDLLASGGMASIHRAWDRWAQREVAYKRARVPDEAHRARLHALFRGEYDTLARLSHPTIVRVFDYGFDPSGPYYTMELLTGDDLARSEPLSLRETCRVARDVASALSLVHARRLVHRDVSPNNVRLTGDGTAKLIDFGALTPFGTPPQIVGTPAFVAPECLTHEPLDARVDLYALGALLYWMLTRKLAVRALSIDTLPEALAQPLVPPSQHVPEIPPELDELVLSLLARDRAARPAAAADVIERLTTLADLEPERHEAKVALSYLKHAPLQGRREVLAEVARELDALAQGRGGVLVFEGARGTGRSALLESLSIEAQLRGATVLRAEGKVHTRPLEAASHLMETGLASHPDLSRMFQKRHSSMWSDPAARKTPTEAVERHALASATIRDALLQIALRGPLVLLVDDIESLDQPSLSLLASMIDAIGRHAILLALTRTNEPPQHDAEVVLLANAERLKLGPLRDDELGALLETMLGDVPNARTLSRFLFVESGGNPAHCLSLVEALLRRGAIRYARGTFVIAPHVGEALERENTTSFLFERLRDLGAEAEQLARVLSVSGSALGLRQLAVASGLTAAQALEALEALHARGLVVAAGAKYGLTSQALRAGVTAALEQDERRSYHLSLAEVLLAGDAPSLDERLAAGLHLIEAGDGEALRGADLIHDLTVDHIAELGISGRATRALEAALAVYQEHGHDDRDCTDLLIPLTVGGFYGDLAVQRRYFERAMRALAAQTGLGLATRLGRFVGGRLALILGIVGALIVRPLRRTKRRRDTSVKEDLASTIFVASCSTAAAACALDTREAERIVAWLAPLASARPGSAIQVGRQFCLAVADTSANCMSRALARYEQLSFWLEKPIPGMKEHIRAEMKSGTLNGIAQTCVESEPRRALAVADQLERSTLFYAPHAQAVRTAYHVYRGERDAAELHRGRAEARALLGGLSWSALVLLNVRAAVGCLLTDDVLGLVRVADELARLRHLSPALDVQHTLTQADLLRLRGQPETALPLFESALSSEVGLRMPSRPIACAMYARALSDCGRHDEAKRVCERALAEQTDEGFANHRLTLERQLALIEGALGEFDAANARLGSELEQAARDHDDNPLELGLIERERAQVALLAHDHEAFEAAFERMKQQFARTNNPLLLQQCDTLLARAARTGLRPSLLLDAPQNDVANALDGETVLETAADPGPTLAGRRA